MTEEFLNTLIKFKHGLGDAVQFTSVLQHLKDVKSSWQIDMLSFYGKHSAFIGQCRHSFIYGRNEPKESDYDIVVDIAWPEPYDSYIDSSSTKAEKCLREVFKIQPTKELCNYKVIIDDYSNNAAIDYLARICNGRKIGATGKYPAVVIHYEGNTSCGNKNLNHETVDFLCKVAMSLGYIPIILDWDKRSPLPDNIKIFNPGLEQTVLWANEGTGDARRIAALIEHSSLFVGIDSGPQKVAGSTSTPSIGAWVHHHPLHYYNTSENFIHLIPKQHQDYIRGDKNNGIAFFENNYKYKVYDDIFRSLSATAYNILTGEVFDENQIFLKQLRSKSYDKSYYQEHRAAGLDYLNYNAWQTNYAKWLVECFDLKGKQVLDVGCACGSIVRGFGDNGAYVQGIDVSEYMINLAKQNKPDMSPILFACDAINMHMFPDSQFDFIHSAQVGEHWKPKLVPFILEEIARVTRKGGLMFLCMDTEELFARQGRKIENEDPTHICIKTMKWWQDMLEANGWVVKTDDYLQKMKDHPDSYLKTYDWDFVVAERV